MNHARSLAALCLFAVLAVVPAQTQAQTQSSNLDIPRIEQQPQFSDFAGMAPASDLARRMAKIENFVQRTPTDGASASQRTEVYLSYDQKTLYAVFLAFDSNPALIRANLASRENIGGDDSVELTLDTFNDQRSAVTNLE